MALWLRRVRRREADPRQYPVSKPQPFTPAIAYASSLQARDATYKTLNIAARWRRAKASSKHSQEILCAIILTIGNKAAGGNRA